VQVKVIALGSIRPTINDKKLSVRSHAENCRADRIIQLITYNFQVLLNRIAVKIAFFLNGFIYANWLSRLPRIQEQYNADNGTIGLVLLALALGAFGAMPFTGWVIIKKGSRAVSLVSLLLYCALTPFIPFMVDIAALILLFIFIGISTGMLDVAMNAQAVMVERQYRKPIMTSFHAFFSIGMALGAWCGALFADLSIELTTHLITISAISLVFIIWMRRNLIEDKPDTSTVTDGPLFRMPNRPMLGVGVIAFCCMIGEGAISEWSVNYMENIALSPRSLAPIALSAFATAMTLGRLFGDRFRALWGDTRLIVLGGLISTTGLVTALLIPAPYVAITGFFLVGLGLSTIVPITYSIAGNAKGLPPGVGLAMVTTVGYSGFLFGPPVIGFVADVSNLRISLTFIAFLLVVMTILGVARTSGESSKA
jgi:MFS family permease